MEGGPRDSRYDDYGGGGSKDTRVSKENVTDAVCQKFDATATKQFERLEPDWNSQEWDPKTGMMSDPKVKKLFYCGFGGNAAASKTACLKGCTDTLKPGKSLECRKEVGADGKCGKGWVVKRDWRFDFGASGNVKYCVGGTRADYPIAFRNPQTFHGFFTVHVPMRYRKFLSI